MRNESALSGVEWVSVTGGKDTVARERTSGDLITANCLQQDCFRDNGSLLRMPIPDSVSSGIFSFVS